MLGWSWLWNAEDVWPDEPGQLSEGAFHVVLNIGVSFINPQLRVTWPMWLYIPDSDIALWPIWPLHETGGLELTRTIA